MFLKNSKGQMVIFFVFIFQILFILFAMTLNVALITHDKINLQNSLDLAAMYGAKKQAEVLNAVAHINYQMRQNYKLLAWRYRILGSLTNSGTSLPSAQAWCPKIKGKEGVACSATSDNKNCKDSIYPNSYCDTGFTVCINAPIWNKGQKGNLKTGDDYCQNLGFTVPSIGSIKVIAGFIPGVAAAARKHDLARKKIGDICGKEAGISKLITHIFLSHFRLDQKDRKIMIQALYDKTLKVGKDLDGNFIAGGVEKVFRKNLTYTNFKNYDLSKGKVLTFFNSLENKDFKDFLEPLNIFPILMYMDLTDTCSGSSYALFSKKELPQLEGDFHEFYKAYKQLFEYNHLISNKDHHIGTLTLGYKKKKDLTFYYGVKAVVSYDQLSQLFLPKPSDAPVLKASSFAKPFGGRIGPDKEADLILKPQIDLALSAGKSGAPPAINLQPNYSRYVGDRWGLLDKNLHQGSTAFLIKGPKRAGTPYSLGLFDHLDVLDRVDPLASDPESPNPHLNFVRIMELMAVFPDAFDITHYSISNNYMETYFPKICKLIGANGSCSPNKREPINFPVSNPPAYIRGDFGYPNSQQYLQENMQATKIANSFVPFFYAKNKNPVDLAKIPPANNYTGSNTRYPYLVSDPAHFLTSWAPPTNKERYSNYSFPRQMFAKCYSHTSNSSPNNLLPTPSGCEQGGRSGYSIKTISCDMVKTFQPQPKNIREFCS